MTEKLSAEQVSDLLGILRTDASVDAKVQQVTAVKSGIKQHNVPDPCVAQLFEALRTASSSQHAVLVNAGFTALNHLLTRLSRQEPKFLVKEASRTLPLIIEKLGDQKEKFRSLAAQALVTLWLSAPLEVERSVRNTALVGKNARAKEAGLQWLLQMHQEHGLQFRGYVPTLMELLEDADGVVRDTAKSTVIELFRNAPGTAKSDLKRQLKNFKVRPAIEQAIIKELVPTSSNAAAPQQASRDDDPPPAAAAPSRQNLAASVSSLSSEPRPVTPMFDVRAEQVEPTYVNTQRELDDIFKGMHLHFDGKETEQNWLKREESMTTLRRLIAGNATSDFRDSFLGGLRGLLDGIIKAATSLRTSLSKEASCLVQDIANAYGSGIDPMVELLLQTFVKLCAATKKLSSQLANTTVETIIANASYSGRIMQHVWGACQDKNVQPRTYATAWVKTLLLKESRHKNYVEHSGGLDLFEKCIKRGLADANPAVREKMRATYWTFSGLWPARAETIMTNLDATAQKLLRNDPHNPNSPKKETGGGSASGPSTTATRTRPGMGLSKSTMGSSKPSLRETMLAQKKALASNNSNPKNLPARPGSAMSHFSPVRTTSNSSTATSASSSSATSTGTRQRPESTLAAAPGGLSVAPMRPARRRPEMVARPATAGPYSVRNHGQTPAEQASPPPANVRTRPAVTPRTGGASPKRTVQRPRPGHATTASESSLPSPAKLTSSRSALSPRASPRASPPKPKPSHSTAADSPSSAGSAATTPLAPAAIISRAASPAVVPAATAPASPASGGLAMVHENSALVMPATATNGNAIVAAEAASPPKSASPPKATVKDEAPSPETPSKPLKVYEDPSSQDQQETPRPTFTGPVLEDKPINEDAGNLARQGGEADEGAREAGSPERTKQNLRLLDSGISKIRQKTLDVHGFRKLQGIIRDNKVVLTDDRFDPLVAGLFEFLESPLDHVAPDKVQDVKAQVLATIKLLLRRARDGFRPHVSRGLESMLRGRAGYTGRTHMVSGLELLADELVALGDAGELSVVLCRMLGGMMDPSPGQGHDGGNDDAPANARSLSMGLHALRSMVDAKPDFQPADAELACLAGLASRCLESTESGVRMDAVQLCVALHARVGDQRFWDALRGVKDDPKSLITYYIVKRQREKPAGSPAPATVAAPAAVAQ